jgi:hypothetical protein
MVQNIQHPLFHVMNYLFHFLIKKEKLPTHQNIMNNHKCIVLVKVMVCKNNEVQGASNEPMPSTFAQNTINDNGGQNFNYCLTNIYFHDNYDIEFMGNNGPFSTSNLPGQDFKTYCLIVINDKMYNLILSKTNRLVVLHLIKCPSDRIVE